MFKLNKLYSALIAQTLTLGMTDATAGASTLPAGWATLRVDISKKAPDGKGGNEYQKIGEMAIPVPTLAAFGVDAKTRARTEDDGEDDGLPLYEDKNMDWLFGAIVASCKAQARNKLVPQTADLKDGQKIASNFDELTAEGERRGNAEALKLAKEISNAFTSWFTTLAKSVAATAMATTLFRKRDALAIQPNDIKKKMQSYLQQFAETLEPADAERYSKYLLAVEEACSATTAEDF